MSVKMKFGSKDIPFVYKGDKLVYPNPIKDGLLLWYDFKGMRNTDTNKEVAKDLSGNGNDGTLQNFNYNTSDFSSDFSLPELYKNTKLIVKDPSDPIYSDYPNPPVGAVFNNYNPVSNKIVRGNIDMPALVNTLVANMKLYHLYNDSVFLENAEIIGTYISSLMRNFSFYGADTWVVPNRVSLIDGEWTPLYGEINTRSLLQATYALSEVLKVTGLYGSEVYQLTQTIGLMHNNIKSRVAEGELRAAMNGAVYEYIYTNEETGTLVFSWGEFGISSSDMIAKAMNSYIESMGEDVIYDSQGTEFTPQQILDGAAEHIKAVYDSGVLTMEPTGLPYSFLQANSESETGVNWDWVDTQERGDTWFTNDTTLWIIEGISRLSQLTEIEGIYNIAKTYRDNFLALRELNHNSYDDKGNTRVIFYDRYNFDGSHLTDDVSISISGTALLWEVDEILGIKDGILHSQMRDTLEAHINTNENSDINGAFGWDANDATSFIEMKATGEIYFSPFIQADLSVSSGYKDNTLVFDGVDDKLVIPELELDENAMTVMHDGNLYAYEDDKVIKVKKYSEDDSAELDGLEVGGRNLVLRKDELKDRMIDTSGEFRLYLKTSGMRDFIKVQPEEKLIFTKTIVPEDQEGYLLNYWRYAWFDKEGNFISRHSDSKSNVLIIVPENAYNLRVSYPADSDVKIEKGTTATDWTPAPEDFQTTSLSPSSLSNLQLYNRPLRKDELLHNVESKGLKKLKPGVVVQDGLLIHYDFSHESNTSEYKDKAFDYSGNGNHGVLNNFNFTEESGYRDKGLKYDNIDDFVTPNLSERVTDFTILSTVYFSEEESGMIWGGIPSAFYLRRNLGHGLHGSIYISGGEGIAGKQMSTYASNVFVANEAKKINVGMVVDNESQTYSLIANGEIIRSIDISEELETAPFLLTHVGTWPTLNYANLDGSMHSFQMYNRVLTPEEIQHNYAIEKEKFDITEGDV